VSDFDVRLRAVTKTFGGRRALDDVTLDVRAGEFFSLLGPSGCGKTSLLRLLAGFDVPDAGTIELAGRDMRGVPPHRRDVNLIFQNYALFPHLDAGSNVAFGLRLQGADDISGRVARALAQVGLGGYERRSTTTLSGGEQQRVAIARALVTRPRVLLLDEPLGALDLPLRRGLQEELRRLQRELRMTFVYVTHDQDEALALSDRVAVLRDGRVEQVGTPREIYEHPATRFVAGFVGAANFLDGTGDGLVVRTEDGLVVPSPVRGPVTLLVRPEKLRLDGGVGCPAVVQEILYHGSTTRLVLRAGARTWVVEDLHGGAARGLRVGQSTTLSWRPEDVQVLER